MLQLCKNFLGDKQSRHSTKTRNQEDADFSEITIVLKFLEENNKYIPIFDALNFNRVPKQDLEEINTFALIARVAAIECTLIAANEDISTLKIIVHTRPQITSFALVAPSFL